MPATDPHQVQAAAIYRNHRMNPFTRGYLLLLLLFFFLPPAALAAQDDKFIIDEEKIRASSARTIYELLNQVPGIKATDLSVSIRGSLKVLVLLDQRSINDLTSTYGGVRWDVVELDQVERIVILRGKGGVEYGDNASGGVIDITTKKIDRLQGSVEVKAGNHASREAKASVNRTFGALGVGLNTGYYETDGFRERNGDKKKGRIEARMNTNTTGDLKIGASAFYWQEEKGNPGLPDYPTPNSRGKDQMASGVVNLKWKRFKAKTTANWGNKETRDPDKSLDSYLRVLRLGQEVSSPFDAGFAGMFNWGAGVEHATAASRGFDEKTEEKAFAYVTKAFGFSFLPVSLHTGLRGIYYSEYDNSLSPEVSLTYKRDAISGKLSLSRTVNAPSFTKKYRETSTTIPNPDLTIEKATNVSLTLAWEPDDRFSLSLSPFYNIIDDRITYVRTGGIGQYQNFGEVTYKGVDAGISVKPLDWVSVQSSYTYLEAKDENTGLWLSAKPQHRWINVLEASPLEGLSAGLTATAISNAYSDSANTEKVAGVLIWDFKAEYGVGKFTLLLEIENLFDTDYLKLDGYPAEPFSWMVGMRWRF